MPTWWCIFLPLFQELLLTSLKGKVLVEGLYHQEKIYHEAGMECKKREDNDIFLGNVIEINASLSSEHIHP